MALGHQNGTCTIPQCNIEGLMAMRMRKTISADELRSHLRYEPETGQFYWLHSGKGHFANVVAGNRRPDGYIRINVAGHLYYAHRLAWLYMTGEWPENQIDHINMDPSDNRWTNLRAATPRQNRGNRKVQRNSRSGIKGVYQRKEDGRWIAYICPNGRIKNIGSFATADEAKEARTKVAKGFFGDFYRDE